MINIAFGTNQFNFNCGICEIGKVDADVENVVPTTDEWFEALLTEDIPSRPIVVFSYNKKQTAKTAQPYNIYKFGEWLKEQGETITVSPWARNVNSQIQVATWVPSRKFKAKARRTDKRLGRASTAFNNY